MTSLTMNYLEAVKKPASNKKSSFPIITSRLKQNEEEITTENHIKNHFIPFNWYEISKIIEPDRIDEVISKFEDLCSDYKSEFEFRVSDDEKRLSLTHITADYDDHEVIIYIYCRDCDSVYKSYRSCSGWSDQAYEFKLSYYHCCKCKDAFIDMIDYESNGKKCPICHKK